MSEERWAPVPGYGRYQVSDQGNVRSNRTPRLKPIPLRGHLKVNLYYEGSRWATGHYIHRLVADAFVEGAGPVVRHLDGNPLNNVWTNLAWGTQSDNILDAVQHGTHNNARKTHCKRGHELTPENTRIVGKGRRNCRTCQRAAQARRKA